MKEYAKQKVIDFCYVTDFVANGSFASLRENVSYIKSPDYAILVRLTDFTKKWSKDFVYVSKASYDFLKKSSLIEGDLIMSNVGEPGIVFLVPDLKQPMTLGPNSILIRPNKKYSSSKFLHHYFLSEKGKKQIEEISTGAAQKKFNKTSFRDLDIHLPTLPEQQRIVALLDKAYAAIDKAKANAEQNLKNAKELFESYLQGVFENKGNGWEEKRLWNVCEYEKTSNKRDNLPYVGLEDIQSETGVFIGPFEPRSMKSLTFYFNDEHVLYGRLRPYLNKVLLPDFEGHCSTEIFPIKPKNNVLDRGFLFQWLISNETMKKINATWTGATLPRANMNTVLEFKINLPSLNEQQNIVQKLNALKAETKKLEAIYQQKINDLEELKKSILEKAFKGELKN
ncbi:MAG: restriction endonuclease subunit S [Bacteroidia bacterium]|nr:restriction endonuclease subunit S [Bacteroidia bacterium]MCF8426506.1 restriction endonuclease subunit S [Bacteroidia bacterium]MCF8447515.1 restriction endonuclease subunit S [Bacteroidia bacterium]